MSLIEKNFNEDSCYYSVLGICKQASDAEIRRAYWKLAMKWHPDKWIMDPTIGHQAKKKLQQIQEAYTVLSDKGKRSISDAGFFDLLGDQDDDTGFCEFLQEMALMIDSKNSQKYSLRLLEIAPELMKKHTKDQQQCDVHQNKT